MVDPERLAALKVKVLELTKEENIDDEETLELFASLAKSAFKYASMDREMDQLHLRKLGEDIYLHAAGGRGN